jgi:hypothetical protein
MLFQGWGAWTEKRIPYAPSPETTSPSLAQDGLLCYAVPTLAPSPRRVRALGWSLAKGRAAAARRAFLFANKKIIPLRRRKSRRHCERMAYSTGSRRPQPWSDSSAFSPTHESPAGLASGRSGGGRLCTGPDCDPTQAMGACLTAPTFWAIIIPGSRQSCQAPVRGARQPSSETRLIADKPNLTSWHPAPGSMSCNAPWVWRFSFGVPPRLAAIQKGGVGSRSTIPSPHSAGSGPEDRPGPQQMKERRTHVSQRCI